ncbi:hypothetical protein SSP1734 [Staphylococcus saprophyticus subsp. saprophyticus ATCC 15305]|uniref:Uncharacterized protein n=1 Tax=Staphylococcus saprophyticus subsp. saprophyticus (strain ATCC 15305 / DSM 20229 / NCIMB 8711 / NCTC 7292 / S-41) TaxID=342451 RepID=Q49WI0_STAS1|nr:hypothetical protein SSP1734 [Staphylococcus saprophyticus subsp. saprophyticus ATCC 15305] [Staphylococcus saprophyticus subsp. saprophyticus ATCC 15305 = NCTC 7292]
MISLISKYVCFVVINFSYEKKALN